MRFHLRNRSEYQDPTLHWSGHLQIGCSGSCIFPHWLRQRLTTWSYWLWSNSSSANKIGPQDWYFWLDAIHLVLHCYVVFIGYRFISALNSRSWSSYTNVSILKLRGGTIWAISLHFASQHNYATRSSHDSALLSIPRTRTRTADNAFQVAGTRLWNSLPANMRQAKSLDIFKGELKTHLFN